MTPLLWFGASLAALGSAALAAVLGFGPWAIIAGSTLAALAFRLLLETVMVRAPRMQRDLLRTLADHGPLSESVLEASVVGRLRRWLATRRLKDLEQAKLALSIPDPRAKGRKIYMITAAGRAAVEEEER